MSDLTAANCGCNNGYGGRSAFPGGNYLWIILLLSCCGGNCGGNNGTSLFSSNGSNDSCEWLIWILLISCLCGNNGCCGN